MYCSNCGNRLSGKEQFCTYCGNNVNNTIVNNDDNSNISKYSGNKDASIVLGILGIVGGSLFVFSPISLILSIIGLIIGIKVNKYIKNTACIVLNAIGLFISFLSVLIIIFFISISIGVINDVINDGNSNYYQNTVKF